MPLGDHAAHWSSYIGEVIRGLPLYYPSWLKFSKERKAALITDIGTQFDLRPHMESPDWTKINAGIQQHLGKLNQEYSSLIDTFFVAHTVNREFLRDEDRRIHEEMRRLEATGTYTDEEINRLAIGGKQQGHTPGVGRVLPAQVTASLSTPVHESTLNSLHKKVDFMMSLSKGIVAGEGIPCERSPANIPRRQVAGESLELSLANGLNVVVIPDNILELAYDFPAYDAYLWDGQHNLSLTTSPQEMALYLTVVNVVNKNEAPLSKEVVGKLLRKRNKGKVLVEPYSVLLSTTSLVPFDKVLRKMNKRKAKRLQINAPIPFDADYDLDAFFISLKK
nr:acidic leucine-rich nuclear phosphoprotein 32 family member A [Tanacetum cinerariifolium]